MRTYRFDSISETDGHLDFWNDQYLLVGTAMDQTKTPDIIGEKLKEEFRNTIEANVREEYTKHGINITYFQLIHVAANWRDIGTYVSHLFIPIAWVHQKKLEFAYSFAIQTDVPVEQSPFPAWALLIIKWVITAAVAIVISYFVLQVISSFLNSFTQKKTVIYTYDENGNPIKKEEITEPSITGIITTLGTLTVMGLIAYGVYRLIKGRHKGSRKRSPRREVQDRQGLN